MGIVNCTPDSFYDGGRYHAIDAALAHALKLEEEGADLLDIGGESTRPGADPVDERTEMKRVIPLICALQDATQLPISIDTSKPNVARAALQAGASFINDVTGFCHPEMRHIAAESGAEICVMHMQGTPKTMQQETPYYPGGILPTLTHFFEERIEKLISSGVAEEQIILDPGIGFGKTVQHNVEILQKISELKRLGFPILFGGSRKSFITKTIRKPSRELLSATIAVNTIAIRAGVDLIRVHDVQEHRNVIDLLCGVGWIG